MNNVKYRTLLVISLLAISGVWSTGCNKSAESSDSGTAPAPPTAAQTAQSMDKVKADPNIPPQVKAQIMSSMQNHGRSNPGAGAPTAPK